MIKTDESALVCDLAETYHIYDYRSLPLKTVAAFSVGLRENSRIKMALAGVNYSFDTLLLASILDDLNVLVWSMSENAKKGINKPQSIADKLLGRAEDDNSNEIGFDTAEEFERERERLLGKGGI